MIGASPIFAVRIEREMVAVVRGVAVEDLDDGSGSLTPQPLSPEYRGEGRSCSDVDQAIDKRKVVVEDELLGQTDLGRQILKLRAEREIKQLKCAPRNSPRPIWRVDKIKVKNLTVKSEFLTRFVSHTNCGGGH
ncbi:MAG: hypothetical protein NTY19_44415 [Planctomycetota bacterium]|nr:hypothetical protein [Planctomycetota bacterium]